LVIGLAVAMGCHSPSKNQSDRGGAKPQPRAIPAPTTLSDTLVSEGAFHNLGFTLAFRIMGDAKEAGKSYAEAMQVCRSRGRMLCTESQWLRACEEHSVLGSMESWTATRRGKDVVVAGGKGCGSKEKVKEDDVHPHRMGLCCERAISLRAADAGPWLGLGARLPLRFEQALNQADDKALRGLLADPVVREGRKWSLDDLLAHENKERAQVAWTLFDTCDLRLGPVVVDVSDAGAERKQGMLLTCKTLLAKNGEVIDFTTILGLVGEQEDSLRLVQIDHKGSAYIPGAR
jgi:hypothetical protein